MRSPVILDQTRCSRRLRGGHREPRRAGRDRGPRASTRRSGSPSSGSTRSRSGRPIRSRRVEYRELHALQDVSFDVRKGEFFGIVGRNGSGKSTLLKILASIYRADPGRVRMAGRVAPFIELGVGFNPELTARENVVLNGVLMGLTRREAQRRLDAVIDFAELHEFADLKLKNYSSGMMVRLAFAVMVQADADIMLIDEVLAVGDAAFAQKCMDVFHEQRRAGKTIVLVTHDMATVQSLCHRAMLLARGRDAVHRRRPRRPRCATTGSTSPARAARRGSDPTSARPMLDVNVTAGRGDAARPLGRGDRERRAGEPITDRRSCSRRRATSTSPVFVFHVLQRRRGGDRSRSAPRLEQPARARASGCALRARSRTGSCAGRYYLDCWIRQDEQREHDAGSRGCGCSRFVVYGTARALRRGHARARDVTIRRSSRNGSPMIERGARAAGRPRAVGARRRLAARAGAAVPDRGHRLQEDLLRDRARLPVVAGAAADAVRRPAGGVHAGLPASPATVPHYPVFLLFNIVLFGFFQEATTMAVGSIVGHEAVVRKTQFPRLVIPLAVVLTSAVQPGAEPDRGVRASSSPSASRRCGRGCC